MTTQIPILVDSDEDLQASLRLNDHLSLQNANNLDTTDNSPPLLRKVLGIFCRDFFVVLLTAYHYGLNSFYYSSYFWMFAILLMLPLATTLFCNKNWKQRLWMETVVTYRSLMSHEWARRKTRKNVIKKRSDGEKSKRQIIHENAQQIILPFRQQLNRILQQI